MKKHRLFLSVVTAVLIVVTLEITSPPMAASAPQQWTNTVDNAHPQGVECIIFIIVAIVIGVIIWGLIQMCKRIPPPPPPNDGQPTNITVAIQVKGPDTYAQFQFNWNTNAQYLCAGNVQDELGNTYQLMCSYALQCASNAEGPWKLDGYVTNWLGGSMVVSSNQCLVTGLTNQEVALYDTNGQLLAARRWAINESGLSNCIMPKIVMPPMHLPKEFYRLVLLEQ